MSAPQADRGLIWLWSAEATDHNGESQTFIAAELVIPAWAYANGLHPRWATIVLALRRIFEEASVACRDVDRAWEGITLRTLEGRWWLDVPVTARLLRRLLAEDRLFAVSAALSCRRFEQLGKELEVVTDPSCAVLRVHERKFLTEHSASGLVWGNNTGGPS